MSLSLEEVATWLKTTVPGIIILGAAGSVLAVFILKVAQKLFLELLPARWKLLLEQRLWESYKAGFVFGHLQAKKDVFSLVTFYIYRAIKIMFLLFFSMLFLLQFLYFVLRPSGDILTAGSYFALVMAMLMLYWALREGRFIFWDYQGALGPIISECGKFFDKRYKNKGSGEQKADEGKK